MADLRIAWLVYDPSLKPAARRSTAFDVLTNAGAYVVTDLLERAGFSIGFCSPETAHEHDVVMVSMTSTYDTYHLIKAVARLQSWRKPRRFITIAGGFGLQNVYPLRHYIDWACFGRAEGFIVDLMQALRDRRDFEHESVMHLAEGVTPVKIAQVGQTYPRRLETDPPFDEQEIGCARRCYFCHYTWARKLVSPHKDRFRGNMGYASNEIWLDHISDHSDHKNIIRTGMDGVSERLRLAFNKPIRDAQIKEQIERASMDWLGNMIRINLYNIGSYPTETPEDLESMYQLFRSIEPQGKRVVITIHLGPFRPSPCTPSAWMPANLEFDWSRLSLTNIVKKPLIEVFWTQSLEGPFSHLLSLVAERATEQSDTLINTICFGKGLSSLSVADKVRALGKTFDLSQYTREYWLDEQLPTWYLEGHTPIDQMKQLASGLRQRLGMAE